MKHKLIKVCSKCGEPKPISEYHRHKHGKYGRKAMCKECVKAINKGQYIFRRYEPKKGEMFEAWLKKYHQKHPASPFVCKRPKVKIAFPILKNDKVCYFYDHKRKQSSMRYSLIYCTESENWKFPHKYYYFKPSRPV